MTDTVVDPSPQVDAALRADLLAAGLLVELGAQGLYARSMTFERIVDALSREVRAGFGDAAPTQLMLPWVIPAQLLADSDYLRSFPDMTGRVFGFDGNDRAHARLLSTLEAGGDWSTELSPTDVALCSAGCHPVYPMFAGRVLPAPVRVDAVGHCFRNEPSPQPGRMRTFRQHEQICIGLPEVAEAHRLAWLDRAEAFFASLSLPVHREVANDPFFGRIGNVLAAGQRDQALKDEVVADVGGRPTAIASGNNHQDHFTAPFSISSDDGAVLHSACIGFGLERITLALLSCHGLDVTAWPDEVTARLWP